MIPSAASPACCPYRINMTALHRGDVSAHRIHLASSRLLGKDGQTQRLLQRQKPVNRHQRCPRVKAVITVTVDKDPEKEASRKYRRTVFTHENWAMHRSTDRYPRHVVTLFQSRIVRGLLRPLLTLVSMASAVSLYETLRETHVLGPAFPTISFNLTAPISSTSFALSLLLVFRTNSSYARWDEARKLWGGITNRSRDIVRQAITFVPAEETELVDMYKRWATAFPITLMCHLREAEDLPAALKNVLQPEELKVLMESTHRPNFILQVLSEMIGDSCILTPERFRMDENLTFFADALGACERILKTPIPLSYTRHTSRFLIAWLALMPFTLYKSAHLLSIPATGMIAFLLLGIEEIGVQIEEPFSILPLEAICATIQTNIIELNAKRGDIKQLVSPTTKKAAANQANGNSNGNGKKLVKAGDREYYPDA